MSEPNAMHETASAAPIAEPIRPRLTRTLEKPCPDQAPDRPITIGMFLGEGVGPEVVPVAMDLLDMLAADAGRDLRVHQGGLIGLPAKRQFGSSLSDEVTQFAETIFAEHGALFCGPGGDRFVYEIRRKFDLYCKYTPIEPLPELRGAGVVRDAAIAATDIIAVRENMGGVYQGEWDESRDGCERIASHRFAYREGDIRRILGVAMRLVDTRRRRVHLVLKPGGVPSISTLWRTVAEEMAETHGIDLFELEIDNAVYQLIADPAKFDVLVSPNMFGDILADCGSLLLASRGLSYSGNFNDRGDGVYQTGHGAARDIAGKDVANPIGQILSLGMMLRESFCWPEADQALRQAVRATLAQGLATADVATGGVRVVGTRAFGDAVAANLQSHLAAAQVK